MTLLQLVTRLETRVLVLIEATKPPGGWTAEQRAAVKWVTEALDNIHQFRAAAANAERDAAPGGQP